MQLEALRLKNSYFFHDNGEIFSLSRAELFYLKRYNDWLEQYQKKIQFVYPYMVAEWNRLRSFFFKIFKNPSQFHNKYGIAARS